MTDTTNKMIAAAVSAATTRAFDDAGMQQEYRDGMRYMRAEIITALANAMREHNPRFDDEAFRAACLTPNRAASEPMPTVSAQHRNTNR